MGPARRGPGTFHPRHDRPAGLRQLRPRLLARASFALGPTAHADVDTDLRHYYRFLGPRADQAVAEALTTPGHLTAAVDAFAQAGCDELILFPSNPDPTQIDQLSHALPGHQQVHGG
jgi:hypothetical protein